MKKQMVITEESRWYQGIWAFGTVSVFLVLMFVGCEEINSPVELTTFEDQDGEELAKVIADDLELSATERAEVYRAFSRHEQERRRPGFLWYVAGELQKSFTEVQMERVYDLIERYEYRLAQKGEFMFFDGWPFLTGDDGGGGNNCSPRLTDEQLERMKYIREAYAKQLEYLKNRFRNGDVSEKEYRRYKHAILHALNQEYLNLLTDEQKIRWRRCVASVNGLIEDHRGQAFMVMVKVLDLQREQRDALVSMQKRLRQQYAALIRDLQAGEIDRDDFIDGLINLRDARIEMLAEILDRKQFDIIHIHQALVIRKALNQFRNLEQGVRE